MNARLIFTHALSPLHAGTGQGAGVIDLPIVREKATGIPFLPGSSLKGTLRDGCTHADKEKVYGPEKNNADDHAGTAQFTDQRLLCLPIRSLAGTFAWVTSPYLLHRFARDAASAGVTNLSAVPTVADGMCCVVQSYSEAGQSVQCKLKLNIGSAQKVVLEDLDLNPTENDKATNWGKAIGAYIFQGDTIWKQMLGERLCIVSDDVFGFLINMATEVFARTKLLDDTKTVQKGGLWYEEALPAETILYGLIVATPNAKASLSPNDIFAVVQSSIPPSLQLGGKATVGRGFCHVIMHNV